MGPFEEAPRIAVAISGGPDSLALCLLAREWATQHHGTVHAIHIDHGLRASSGEEARQVISWLKEYHIPCDVIHLSDISSDSAIQASAREKRYEALATWCRQHHILHLLLGHHRDDQRETYLMRRDAGSQEFGLAGISAIREWQGVRLLRPLLAFDKVDLQAWLEARNQSWLADPSNLDQTFTRVKTRQTLAALSTQECRQIDNAITQAQTHRKEMTGKMAATLARYVTCHDEGFLRIERQMFNEVTHDEAVHTLGNAIACIAGSYHPPRREKLEGLLGALQQWTHPLTRTLSGCVIKSYCNKTGESLLIYREQQAIGSDMVIHHSGVYQWDHRFRLSITLSQEKMPITLRALGQNGCQQLNMPSSSHLRPAILRTLPSLWHLDSLLCVPHMEYMAENNIIRQLDCIFHPAKPLADAPFFAMTNAV